MLKIHVIPVTPFAQNCSIIMCTQTNAAAVVDPGGDVDAIMQAVRQMNANVEQILLTHGHLITPPVRRHFGGGGTAIGNRTRCPDHRGRIRQISIGWTTCPRGRGLWFWRGQMAFTPTRYLQDGDEIQVRRAAFAGIALSRPYAGSCGVFHDGMRGRGSVMCCSKARLVVPIFRVAITAT